MGRILVVEDDESFSLMLCAALRERGHEVFAVFCGKDGIQNAPTLQPDLVLLDYHLADMNGYAVAMGLRSMSVTAHIPFVLLCSFDVGASLGGIFEKSVNCRAILAKALPLSEILSILEKVIMGLRMKNGPVDDLIH